ncbi:hypothetical protein [Stenotrophomonas maltophilia]|uniref:Transmembrane protein n=1 Tax=Stenotrophomonas maltophilia (strain R551-3) TaxID=391008 RepID=B4ST82_STRM5|nr:hypothetical protein [Stenotrophomonas maltophilia]ACF52873.1 hypothetical protein Smal_3174 [Stenotrophomonas maltophilia R551-3]
MSMVLNESRAKDLIASPRVWMAVLLVLVAGIFWPGLRGPFIFDDFGTIVDNSAIHVEKLGWPELWRAATSFDPGGLLGARPLSMVSFALNYVGSGLDPWAYKLVGLLVHLINVVLVLLLTRRILNHLRVVPAAVALRISFFVALIWAVHPLQISSVLYVVQRMETLAASFMLGALLCYLQARERQIQGGCAWPWLVACLPLALLGVLAKESGVLVVAYGVLLEWGVLAFQARSLRVARFWKLLCIVAVITAVVGYLFVVAPAYWVDTYFGRDFGTYERLLSQLRILCMYLGQVFWPLPNALTFYYDDFQPSHGWLYPVSTLVSGVALLALLLVALGLRRKVPLFCLGIVWFFVSHMLTSNVVGLELIFEHRNYLALLGILWAIVAIAVHIRIESVVVRWAAVSAIVVLLSGASLIRSSVWGNRLLLATDMALENPRSARAANELGAIYLEMSDGYADSPFNDLAIGEFERSASLPGSSVISDQGLILAATQAGRLVPDAWWQRLIGKLQHQPIAPEVSGALFSLMNSRYKGFELDDGRLVEAFGVLFERATLPPNSYAQFGDYLLTHAGNPGLADWAFAKSVEESVGWPGYAQKVIDELERQGHTHQANVARDTARRLGIDVEHSDETQAQRPQ